MGIASSGRVARLCCAKSMFYLIKPDFIIMNLLYCLPLRLSSQENIFFKLPAQTGNCRPRQSRTAFTFFNGLLNPWLTAFLLTAKQIRRGHPDSHWSSRFCFHGFKMDPA
jgi:hypothetical protein